MSAGNIRVPPPRWYLIPVRVLLVTFLLTLLSFAVGLFLSIVGLVIVGKAAGAPLNMTHAYRHMALPFAAVVAFAVLVSATVVEVRRYRQAKALASIERLS
jgi:hypothetical protein